MSDRPGNRRQAFSFKTNFLNQKSVSRLQREPRDVSSRLKLQLWLAINPSRDRLCRVIPNPDENIFADMNLLDFQRMKPSLFSSNPIKLNDAFADAGIDPDLPHWFEKWTFNLVFVPVSIGSRAELRSKILARPRADLDRSRRLGLVRAKSSASGISR